MNYDDCDRIFFAGNPWPEGHPIRTFQWSARLCDGMVWFDFHLETIDYDAERDIRLGEDEDDVPGWSGTTTTPVPCPRTSGTTAAFRYADWRNTTSTASTDWS